MGTQYIISHVMLEEHRHNVARSMPNPDWPDAVFVGRAARFAGLRQRVSDLLFAMADRLEPAADRARSGNREALASEPMR